MLVHYSLYTGCIYRVLTPCELKNQAVNLYCICNNADAFNIAQLLVKDATLTLPAALQQYYHPTGKARYKILLQDFYNGRFGGNAKAAAATATNMLMAIDNIKIAAGRQVFFNKKMAFKNLLKQPDLVDTESSSAGFVTKFLALIAAEKLMP
jgi:hypothetical protein